jgi:hypothetical protein
MKFKSKTDAYFLLLLTLILILYNAIPVYSLTESGLEWSDFIQVIPFFGLSMLMIISVNQYLYKIKNDVLIVKGVFINETIPIQRIHSISLEKKYVFSPGAATASSGLVIHYQTSYKLYITPKDQEKFIQHLLEVNPHIELADLINTTA